MKDIKAYTSLSSHNRGDTTTSCDEHRDMAWSRLDGYPHSLSSSLSRHTTTFLSKPRTCWYMATQTTLLLDVATSSMSEYIITRTGTFSSFSFFSMAASSMMGNIDKISTSLYCRSGGGLPPVYEPSAWDDVESSNANINIKVFFIFREKTCIHEKNNYR